jgi:hypothetical protein
MGARRSHLGGRDDLACVTPDLYVQGFQSALEKDLCRAAGVVLHWVEVHAA